MNLCVTLNVTNVCKYMISSFLKLSSGDVKNTEYTKLNFLMLSHYICVSLSFSLLRHVCVVEGKFESLFFTFKIISCVSVIK